MQPEGEPDQPPPIDPHALLRHARQRVEAADADETDYRRAVSDAYYALYHALTALAASLLASSDDPGDAWRQIRRFRHWHVRAAAGAMSESADARTRMVARATIELQGRRMDADYDYFAEFRRGHVETLIDLADRAVEALDGGGGEALAQRLAAMLDAS